MSAVAPTQTSEAGGLQGTAQNLGSSLGTAIIGAVLLGALATGFSERVTANSAVPAAARELIVANAENGIDIVPVAAVEDAAREGGLTPDQAHAVAADYGEAQLDALRLSLGAVALAALLSLCLTRGLPGRSLTAPKKSATDARSSLSASHVFRVMPGQPWSVSLPEVSTVSHRQRRRRDYRPVRRHGTRRLHGHGVGR
jgi:hypothetical protein